MALFKLSALHALTLLGCLLLPALVSPAAAQSLYTTGNWDEAVDTAWGEGLPTEDKLVIFDNGIATLESRFAAFHDRDLNVDSLAAHYRPQIEAGVSRGRFNAIMNRMGLLAQEGHTFFGDLMVSGPGPRTPATPLFQLDGWTDVRHFGASLTPLPDSTLLVYKTVSNHPLGLEPGDIVLGYEGIPWRTLMRELWALELPISFSFPTGTSDEARDHMMLSAAGMNWHLFDTIDIQKHDTNEVQHLSTAPLADQTAPLWGNEQLPVSGVAPPPFVRPFFDPFPSNTFSWGFVEGTEIAYLYANWWLGSSGPRFRAVVDSLLSEVDSDGMIIDLRLNHGGGGNTSIFPALELIFDETIPTVGWDRRCGDPENHFEMCPDPNRPTADYVINGDSGTFYDKPIAVLTGPGCFSACDQAAYRLALHPNARLFGKPTAGGHTVGSPAPLGDPGWFGLISSSIAYPVDEPGQYLARWGTPVDEEVWFTPDDVAEGRDTIVEAARTWIEKQSTDAGDGTQGTAEPRTVLGAAYPNPFGETTTLYYETAEAGSVEVAIFDVTGRRVRTLMDAVRPAGSHEVVWDGRDGSGRRVSAGTYVYRLAVGGLEQHAGRLTLLR